MTLSNRERAAIDHDREYGINPQERKRMELDRKTWYPYEYKEEKARADLMEETRLGQKAKLQQAQDHAILRDEQKLGRTQEALGKLGAGKNYGE